MKNIYRIGLIIFALLFTFFIKGADLECYTAESCHKLGFEFYNDFKYVQSIKYSKKAEKFRLKNEDGLLWKSRRNIALAYFNMSMFREANLYFIKAFETKGKKKAKHSVQLLRNIGACFLEMGDIERALEYGTNAIKINTDNSNSSIAYAQLSEILNETNNENQILTAIQHSDKAIQLSREIQNQQNIQYATTVKGNSYNKLKQYQQAIETYTSAYDINIEIGDTVASSDILNNIATVFFYKKQYQTAIDQLHQSLNLLKSYYNLEFNYGYAATHENLADNYTALHQFDTALLHYQKALINLTNNFHNQDIFQNPNPKDTTLFIYSNPDIIRVLHLKAIATYQYYQQNNNQKYLALANKCYQTAFNFHDQLQKEITTENSRLFQVKNIVPYIENALKVTYQQQKNGHDVSKVAFRFIEKNKATVLLQSVNEADALRFANLPYILLEQEKDLKMSITFHKKQLNEAIEFEEVEEIEWLSKILFDEKQQYSQLINNLENNYPEYYRLKYQQNQTKLVDIQNRLDDKKALLEYFVGDSTIYILSIQKDQSKLYQLNKPNNWQETIENFRQSLTLKNTTQKPELDRQFVQSSAQLYNWLIKEALDSLNEKTTSLQIIPDGVLNYIPFEVLLPKSNLTETINYKTLPYLLKEKAIGYSYSAALWLEQQQKQKSDEKSITYAGFAPEYGKSSGQFKLPFAIESVKENAELFKGKAFIKNQATRLQFEVFSPQFSVVQLAMHVLMNDEKPMETQLLFSQTNGNLNAELSAADLYNMQIDKELAVLGACNTGSGQLQNGEGVMSLSRAFTYAGCSSLMMSLWSIVDQSTATIVNLFFKNLKQGASKDLALQQAKLHFLENATSVQAHPRYWAALLISGNQQAIVEPSNSVWWGLVAIPLLLIAYGFMQYISKF